MSKLIKTTKTLKLFAKLGIAFLIAAMMIVSALYTYMQLALPDASTLRDAHLQVPLRIFSQDKQLIAEFGDKRRIPITYEEIPKPLLQALLATEDKNFFTNPGIDIFGLARATVILATTGHKTQGGSTITMQVARNFFLSSKKTYTRKLNEILLAIKIDNALSKKEILQLYFNKVFLGERAYGFAAAAQIYYGKSLDELNLAQYAMLAGLPKSPSGANPVNNPTRALQRRNHVLSRMLELGYISTQDYQEASQQPITASYHQLKVSVQAPYVAELIREKLYHKYGDDIYSLGLDVVTTIDSKAQAAANNAVLKALLEYARRHGYHRPTQNLGNYLIDNLNSQTHDSQKLSTQQSDDSQLSNNLNSYSQMSEIKTMNNKAKWLETLKEIEPVYQLQAAAVISIDDENHKQATALLANGNEIIIPWKNMSWAQPIMKNGKLGKIPEKPSEILSVGDVIRVYLDKTNNEWLLSQIPEIEGALIAADPNNGAILAMVGGIDFNKSHFNRVTQAQRQVGSALKPFMYAAALSKGMTLATIINDSPIVIEDTGENTLWRPQNDTKKFYGPTRLREGLVESMNLLSIRLVQQTGIPYTIDYLKKFGFNADAMPHSLSLAIGTADVTPLQLANSFTVFANGGYLMTPYIINTIDTQNNKTLYQHTAVKICQDEEEKLDDVLETYQCAPQAIDPKIAYLLNSAMQDVMKNGTAKKTRELDRSDIAGKTGTSDDQNDAWFAGYNQNIVAVTWVGFDEPKSTNEYGAQAALPMWIEFMQPMLAGTEETSLKQPDGLITVRIDPKTGLRVRPGQQPFIFEKFRKEYVPEYETAQNNNSLVGTNTASNNETNTESSSNADLDTDSISEPTNSSSQNTKPNNASANLTDLY